VFLGFVIVQFFQNISASRLIGTGPFGFCKYVTEFGGKAAIEASKRKRGKEMS
jgi:hypothetical protein